MHKSPWIQNLPWKMFLGLTFLAVCACGCSRGLKEGLYAFTGASGKATLISGKEKAPQLATQYGGIRVEKLISDVGDTCPPEFMAELPVQIEKQLQYRSASFSEKIKGKDKEELGPFFTGPANKILVIQGKVIQYDSGNIVDKALGPLDEAILRVTFTDADTQKVLVVANATGRVKSSVRTGPKELANGIAKAIRKILKTKDKD